MTVAAGQIPQFALDSHVAPVILTILRGTSAGVYNRVARIVVMQEVGTLFDQGATIGGAAWSSTGVPASVAIPATNSTAELTLFRRTFGGFRKEVYATAPPALGAYSAGDVCINTAPAAGGVPGWRCVTTGEPATWKAEGVLAT